MDNATEINNIANDTNNAHNKTKDKTAMSKVKSRKP